MARRGSASPCGHMPVRMDSRMDTRTDKTVGVQADEVKACCSAAYASDWARHLLGESFHAGGLALTKRLGTPLDLGPGKRLLDVAAGRGTSGIFLAQQCGCEVIGIEYGHDSVREATRAAEGAGIAHLVRFEQG